MSCATCLSTRDLLVSKQVLLFSISWQPREHFYWEDSKLHSTLLVCSSSRFEDGMFSDSYLIWQMTIESLWEWHLIIWAIIFHVVTALSDTRPHPVTSPGLAPRLASDSAWILNTNVPASCLFENHQNVLVLYFPTQPSCKISLEANITNLSLTKSHRDPRAFPPRPLPASSGCPWSPWAPSAPSSSSPRCRASRAPRLPCYKTRPQETFLNARKYLCFLRFSFGTLHCTGSFKWIPGIFV